MANFHFLVLENDLFHINEKQDFIMKIVHTVQPAVRAAEAPGAEAEVEVLAAHDHIQDHQDLIQDQDLAQEVRIEVDTEVEEV